MGIYGVSTASNMPQNCGMEGMHNSASKKIEKSQVNQPEQIKKITDGVRGQKVDLVV